MQMDTKTLLDHIKNDFMPNLEVAYRTHIPNGKDKWTSWILWSEWKYPFLPNYRLVTPRELVFETDFPTKEENQKYADQIIAKLKDQGFWHLAVFTGSKSIHVHTFFKCSEPEKIDKKKVAERILGPDLYKVIDKANLTGKRMIQIENVQNPKTGKMTEEYAASGGSEVDITDSDYITAPAYKTKSSTVICTKKGNLIDNGSPEYCAFLEHVSNVKLPAGNRHLNVDVNFAAYLNANPSKKDIFEKYHETQGKNLSTGWIAKDSQFNCKQLQAYAKSVGITNPCELCNQYGTYKSSRLNLFIKIKKANERKAKMEAKKKCTNQNTLME